MCSFKLVVVRVLTSMTNDKGLSDNLLAKQSNQQCVWQNVTVSQGCCQVNSIEYWYVR
jgi:hypothetical protein